MHDSTQRDTPSLRNVAPSKRIPISFLMSFSSDEPDHHFHDLHKYQQSHYNQLHSRLLLTGAKKTYRNCCLDVYTLHLVCRYQSLCRCTSEVTSLNRWHEGDGKRMRRLMILLSLTRCLQMRIEYCSSILSVILGGDFQEYPSFTVLYCTQVPFSYLLCVHIKYTHHKNCESLMD